MFLYLGQRKQPGQGKGSKGRQKSQRQSVLLLFEVPLEDKASRLLHMCKGLSLSHACSMVSGLVSVSPYGLTVDSVGFLVSLTSLDHSIFLFFSQHCLSSTQCRAVSLCIYFYQLLDKVSQGTVMQVQQKMINCVSGGLSHIMHCKLSQSLIVHSINFYSIFISAHFVGKTDCRSKALRLVWCPHPSTANLA